MVPEGWKEKVFLKNLLRLDRGSSPRPIVNYITDGEGVNWIKIGDTRASTLTINSTKEKITVEGSKKSRAVYKGEIIVSNSMSYGKPYVLNIDGFIHDGWFVLREYEKKLSKLYLIQLLSSDIVQRQYKRLAAGGVVSNISSELVYSVKINVPPKTEQKKIAQILSTWDRAITTTEQLLANSQQQKKALMQQLLTGKKRLLNESGERFSGEWQWLKADEIFKPISKKNNSSSEELLAVTQDLGVLPRSLLERRVVMPEGSTKSYKLVEPGNFIISLRSFQGGLEYSRHRGLISPAYTVLEPIREISDDFFKHYYKSYNFIGHLAVAVIGIRDGKQISYSDFSFLKLPYPSVKEQTSIAKVLSLADQEVTALKRKINALTGEKKALMQQLLTGKRRVKVDEEVA